MAGEEASLTLSLRPDGHERERLETLVVSHFDAIGRLQCGQRRRLAVQDDGRVRRGFDRHRIPVLTSNGDRVPVNRADRPQHRGEAEIARRSQRRVDSRSGNDHDVGAHARSDVSRIDDTRTDDVDPASIPIPTAPSPTMVIAPAVVVTPTVPVVGVVMVPRSVVPGMIPVVQGVIVMSKGVVPAPRMVGRMGARSVGVSPVSMPPVPMPAVPVRVMPPAPVPMSAAGQGGNRVHHRQADQCCQCERREAIHDCTALLGKVHAS